MNNLLQVVINSLKAKITPIWTKFKMWTNLSFLKTKVATKIRTFFIKAFDIKPKHKKDYYTVFGWMISKKLAFAILLVIGAISGYYLLYVNPPEVFKSTGIKTYSYRSVALRFTKGSVKIKGKSGYVAYNGFVEKGEAVGKGVLYNKHGEIVYIGDFDNSQYNGQGQLYYDNEIMKYNGAFRDNLFEGSGILYHSTGSKEYEGAFAMGKKEGAGTLYDTANNAIYTGNFSYDNLVYNELIGKSTSEVAQYYTGNSMIYEDDSYYVVVMDDIHAVYYGDNTSNTLEQNLDVEGVYVLSSVFPAGDIKCTTVEELKKYFGDADYEGNSNIIMPEAVAIDYLNQKEGAKLAAASLETNSFFDDVQEVTGFNKDYALYLYNFSKDGLNYTFFCNGRNTEFGMYLISKD